MAGEILTRGERHCEKNFGKNWGCWPRFPRRGSLPFACAKPPAAPENTPHLVQQAQTMQGEETLADMVERLSPAVVGIANVQNGKQGIGSGVFVTTDGYVLTNHHVAAAGNEVVMIFSDGAKQSARTVWSSKALDLAVIKARRELCLCGLGQRGKRSCGGERHRHRYAAGTAIPAHRHPRHRQRGGSDAASALRGEYSFSGTVDPDRRGNQSRRTPAGCCSMPKAK